jgi:hypothetical protein
MDPAPFADPIAYCRVVGTIDRPDAAYVGPAVPDWMVQALRRATEASPGAPDSIFRHSVWRCDGHRVLACSFGANLPCDRKAVISRDPPVGAVRFCKDQPGAMVVPAYAVGESNIYEWRCAGVTPAIVRQVAAVDRRGFIARIWYPVAPE